MMDNINTEPSRGRAPFPIRAVRGLWRLAADRVYRNVMWLYFVRPKGAFQPFNDTLGDRYPDIFGFVQTELGTEGTIKILSYGCSVGDEVFSLRRYFPRAIIKGIDINPANIAVCRRRLRKAPDSEISFACVGSIAAETPGSYDAIFCMAVLRHGSLGLPGVTRCDDLIRFEDFARAVADFECCLKPWRIVDHPPQQFPPVRRTNCIPLRNCDAASHRRANTFVRA